MPIARNEGTSDEKNRTQLIKRSWLAIVRRQLESEEIRGQLESICVDPSSTAEDIDRASFSSSDKAEDDEGSAPGEEAEEEEEEDLGSTNLETLAAWYLSLATLPYDVQRRTLEYLYIPMENLLPGNPASWDLLPSDYLQYL